MLHIIRDLLHPVLESHPEVSTADLWAYAGVLAVEFAGGPVTGGTSTLARLVDGHRSTADKARMSAGPRESTVCMSAVVDGFQPDFV